jgi:hypothetical protein
MKNKINGLNDCISYEEILRIFFVKLNGIIGKFQHKSRI